MEKTPSNTPYKKMIEERYKRKKSRLAYSLKLLDKLKQNSDMADSHLLIAAEKHIANAQASLEHEKRILAKTENKPVTKAEKFENCVLEDIFDLFFLGQIWRVAESICIKGGVPSVCHLMDAADIEIKALAKSVQERGAFYHVPIRTSVIMQLGSILIIAEELRKKELS